MLKMFSPRKASHPAHTPPDSPTSVGDATAFSKSDSNSPVSPSTSSSIFVVDGFNILEWKEVEVEVPPGPLGILLDGTCAHAAVIEQFAGIAPSGSRGAIEASGVVTIGSVMVGLNLHNFIAKRTSLEDIGRMLRDTSQLTRRLRFRVPPQSLDERKPQSEFSDGNDNRELLGGVQGNSGSSSIPVAETSKGWSWGGITSTLAMLSPTNSLPQTTFTTTESVQLPPNSPSQSSFVNVTGMEAAPPTSSVTGQGLPGHRVSVLVPAGPIGMTLDGDIEDHAVVLGFALLPDGSRGKLELHGEITHGSVLIGINGEDVSTLSLAAIREKLGASSRSSRRLIFHVPAVPIDDEQSPTEDSSTEKRRRLSYSTPPDSVEDLLQRRRLELALVMKHDRNQLKFKEIWFIVDASWMNRWIEFVARGGAPPGPISNHTLLAEGWRSRKAGASMGRPDDVRSGLQLTKDYRCVVPMVWAILAALHGEGEAPAIARFVQRVLVMLVNYSANIFTKQIPTRHQRGAT